MHKNVDKGAQYEYGVGQEMDEMRVVFYPQVVGDSRRNRGDKNIPCG
jgi:hypothetical protein